MPIEVESNVSYLWGLSGGGIKRFLSVGSLWRWNQTFLICGVFVEVESNVSYLWGLCGGGIKHFLSVGSLWRWNQTFLICGVSDPTRTRGQALVIVFSMFSRGSGGGFVFVVRHFFWDNAVALC